MFGVSGAGLSSIKNYANDGKRTRRSLDQWDRQSKWPWDAPFVPEHNKVSPLEAETSVLTTVFVVMKRDKRLTGSLRGQSDNPIAPLGFELNNPWDVRHSPETLHFHCEPILTLPPQVEPRIS